MAGLPVQVCEYLFTVIYEILVNKKLLYGDNIDSSLELGVRETACFNKTRQKRDPDGV